MEEVKLAFVKWVDSTDHGDIHIDDRDDAKIDYIYSSGFIVNDTPKEITLALHFNWKVDKFTETITIPKKAVEKIRRRTIK